jgi:hypothetical protein
MQNILIFTRAVIGTALVPHVCTTEYVYCQTVLFRYMLILSCLIISEIQLKQFSCFFFFVLAVHHAAMLRTYMAILGLIEFYVSIPQVWT